MEKSKKVLVMACHADDEVLGCGGVICRHIEKGDEVSVCVVTTPKDNSILGRELSYTEELREKLLKEQENVDNFLGITRRILLEHSVLELNKIGRSVLNYSIQKVINKIEPDIIYTHWYNDLNYMHQLVSLATIIGVRPPKKTTVYMYEMESSLFSIQAFKPNYYIEISEYIFKKIKAFSYYKSQYRKDIHPRNAEGIETFAMYRGQEVGLEYAEAFILVREVVI